MQASRTGTKDRALVVQERDLRLLRELSVMRIIDREQAKVVAGFHSTTRANTRLLALTNAGLLKRFFIGTVAGGRKALYYLSSAGATLAQVPHRGPRRRDDETVTTDFFVDHQIGINEIYCLAKYGTPAERFTFVRWDSFYRPIDLARSVIPDGYLVVETPARPVAGFLEFDLGHENLKVWKAKVQAYVRYALSGEFEKQFRLTRFRVLVVTTSDRRRDTIRAMAATITDKLFYFSTMTSIHHHGLWSPIWLRPGSDHEPTSLS